MVELISNHRIGVSQLGSGWAAIHLVDVSDDVDSYTDVQQTGIGRYQTRDGAMQEAREWAECEGVRLEVQP